VIGNGAGEPMWLDFERREPRCRICRDESIRLLVNSLLNWRGVPIPLGGRKTHVVTYADIVRTLQSINVGRDKRDQVSYSSLWVHARRHFDLDGISAYWGGGRIIKEVRKALGDKGV